MMRCNVMVRCDRREPSLSHAAEVANCCATCAHVHHGDLTLDLLRFLFGYCHATTCTGCPFVIHLIEICALYVQLNCKIHILINIRRPA